MKVLVVCKQSPEKIEPEVCKIIQQEGFEVSCSWKNTLSNKEIEGIDFVISVGGDGTTLSASHFLFDKPILSVNLSPDESEGALTTTTHEKIQEKLKIMKEKIETENLERIKVLINGELIPFLALNEVFIANEKAYQMSKYKIKFKGKEELHKSSGLIFSTGTGSTAWFKSAGGKPFPASEKFIKMIVREPYHGRHTKEMTENLTIKENEFIEITPLTDAILAIDSIREINLNANDIIKIQISEYPLKRIK